MLKDRFLASLIVICVFGWGLLIIKGLLPQPEIMVPSLTTDLYEYCYNTEDNKFLICRYKEV